MLQANGTDKASLASSLGLVPGSKLVASMFCLLRSWLKFLHSLDSDLDGLASGISYFSSETRSRKSEPGA